MKKKIIILISIILVLTLLITTLIIINSKNGSSKGNSTITKKNNTEEIKVSDNYDYDFSNYEIVDVNLDEVSDSYKITKGAVYNFTGSLKGYIQISCDDYVKIVLNNVNITNESGSSIYVENSKGTYIELIGDNKLEDGSKYNTDDTNAVIYSKDDLILYGDGKLDISANYNDAIASNDDLVIKSGTYNIESIDDGINGKDSTIIYDGVFNINSGGDSIKTTNDQDTSKGNIIIKNGNFTLNSKNGDAIDSINQIEIDDGNFTIKTLSTSSDNSTKGIKADNNIIIKNITLSIDSIDDAIHSNKDITIESGDITINTNDDGIHADGKIIINDGNYNITASEGIEATYVLINGGVINISAKDDGINAGAKSTLYDVTIEINGGDITIKMGQGDTDAIDSNGNIYINGGVIDITATSSFDYDKEAKYTNGTIIVNGTTTNEITNQMMGGGPRGNMQNQNGITGGDFRRR